MKPLLISTGNLQRTILAGKVVVVTGAGRGIGYETARSLAWLGATVVIAEIDPLTGRAAADLIQTELGEGRARFIPVDIGNERSIREMAGQLLSEQPVFAVVNNATLAPVGCTVPETAVQEWDRSYHVNLRGPVMLAQTFIPPMIARNNGVFVCVSSSGAAPYMGPYEVFKTAQVELAATLAIELEETDVITFTIGPGIVRTPGAMAAFEVLAPLYGHTVESFVAMNKAHLISTEAAGAGFAAAVALAPQFRGQEIHSLQALKAAGIQLSESETEELHKEISTDTLAATAELCGRVRQTLAEQAEGWQQRNLFERQWVVRDFKKYAGMPAEQWLDTLERFEHALLKGDLAGAKTIRSSLPKLAGYYAHLQELAKGYEKDQEKLTENLLIVQGWQDEVEQLTQLLED